MTSEPMTSEPVTPEQSPNAADIAIMQQLCKRDLGTFVQFAWCVLEPSTPLVWNWHLDVLCSHIQAQITSESGMNLLINVPPGTMKSLVVGVFAPAWLWLSHPERRILAASGTPTVVTRDSRRCRELIQSAWYKAMVDWELVWDQNEKLYFANSKGGYRRASGVGSAVTGDRVDWIIVDDPNDASKVTSKPHRQTVNEAWWRDAASNRVANVSTSHRTVVMQRLHQEDLSGYLLDRESGQWEHLLLKMVSEGPINPTWLGWQEKRPVGEPLHPERFPQEFLDKERRKGIAYWSGQHQQNPVPPGGNKFRRDWWGWWSPLGLTSKRPTGCSEAPSVEWKPQGCEYIQSVDATFSDGANSDNVVVLMLGKQGPKWYVLEGIAKQMSFKATQEAIRAQRKRWPRCYATVIERKANGEAIIETLSSELAGVVGVTPIGGKEARAAAVEPTVEAGDVHLPDGWDMALQWVDEFGAFPLAPHDDLVDALSQAILWTRMREGGPQATRSLLSR